MRYKNLPYIFLLSSDTQIVTCSCPGAAYGEIGNVYKFSLTPVLKFFCNVFKKRPRKVILSHFNDWDSRIV